MALLELNDGTKVHVNIPRGHYVGQVRLRGHKWWATVTFAGTKKQRRFKTAESALAAAVRQMGKYHLRARALFIDSSGWYEPTVSMEAKRA